MPQANNNVRREQWQNCDRCGFLYPMSQLVKQKGLLLCMRLCFDNLTVERRPWIIEQTMNPGGATDQEGLDTRQIDRGFFEGFDEQQF
jgi:hypothetical protein